MTKPVLDSLLNRLAEDPSFRSTVLSNPDGALAEFGLQPIDPVKVFPTAADEEDYVAMGCGNSGGCHSHNTSDLSPYLRQNIH